MSLILMLLPAALKIGMTWFEYKVLGTKTKADLDAAANDYAQIKGQGNRSADAREDVEKQQQRIDIIKAEMKRLEDEKIKLQLELLQKENENGLLSGQN